MNKNDLISAVSEQAGITKADASKAVVLASELTAMASGWIAGAAGYLSSTLYW